MTTVLNQKTVLVTTHSVSFRESLSFNNSTPDLLEYSLVYPIYLFVVYLTKLPGIQKHVYETLYPLFLIFVAPK